MPAARPLLALRLRRLFGAVGLACVTAAGLAGDARADGRRPTASAHRSATTATRKAKATTKSATKATTKATPTAKATSRPRTVVRPKAQQKPAKRLTARERARARSIAASARTRAALHRTPMTRDVDSRPLLAVAAERADRLRDSVVSIARAQIGVPYVLGGNTPTSGFDCSGLVKYVMDALHVRLPRTAAEQAQVGKRLARDTDALRPGDLLTFADRGEGVSHIGIYVGNGRMIHASTAAGQVIEVPLIRPPYPTIKPWRGARRVVAVADAPKPSRE